MVSGNGAPAPAVIDAAIKNIASDLATNLPQQPQSAQQSQALGVQAQQQAAQQNKGAENVKQMNDLIKGAVQQYSQKDTKEVVKSAVPAAQQQEKDSQRQVAPPAGGSSAAVALAAPPGSVAGSAGPFLRMTIVASRPPPWWTPVMAHHQSLFLKSAALRSDSLGRGLPPTW